MNSNSIIQNILKKSKQSINPYPGLRPFETNEHPYFFGREKQTNELVYLLGTTRFLSVIGSSGSGKSSLVKAGLLPHLYKGLMSGDGADWMICYMRPGNAPLENLVDSLLDAKLSKQPETNFNEIEFDKKWIKEAIVDNSEGIKHAYDYLNLESRLLIVVDQFEELFRYKKENQAHTEPSKAFVDRLIHAAEQTDKEIFICITMRSDFMGNCSEFHNLPEVLSKGLYLVPRLDRSQLKDAIVQPALLENADVDSALVDMLINELEDKQDQLPILQHALMKTFNIWKSRNEPNTPITIEDYKKSGTMDHALSNHADKIYEKVVLEQLEYADITRELFQCITEGNDKDGIRRPVDLKTICQTINANETDVKKIINHFRDKDTSLLMPPSGIPIHSDTTIDISHESLMRNWVRLQEWVKEEKDNGRVYRRLHDAYEVHKQQLLKKSSSYLSGNQLKHTRGWINSFEPSEEWAERYGGELEKCMEYLRKSYWREKRGAYLWRGLFVISILFLLFSFFKSFQHWTNISGLYKYEVDAKNYMDNNHPTEAFLISNKIITKLEENAITFGAVAFGALNQFSDALSNKPSEFTTDGLKSTAQQNIISTFNSGSFYSWKFQDIAKYDFSPDSSYLLTLDRKNIIRRWSFSEDQPIFDFEDKTFFEKNLHPTNIKVSYDEKYFLVTATQAATNNSTVLIFQNSPTPTLVDSFLVSGFDTRHSSFLKKSSELVHLDFNKKNHLAVRTLNGKIPKYVETVTDTFPSAVEIHFSKNQSFAFILDTLKNDQSIYNNSLAFKIFTSDSSKIKMTAGDFMEVHLFANEEVLFTKSLKGVITIWNLKNNERLFYSTKSFNHTYFDGHLLLFQVDFPSLWYFDLQDLNQSADAIKHAFVILDWSKKYELPQLGAFEDTLIFFQHLKDPSLFATVSINPPPSNFVKLQTKTSDQLFLYDKNYSDGEKNKLLLNYQQQFVNFGGEVDAHSIYRSEKPSCPYGGFLNGNNELLLWDFKKYNPTTFGHGKNIMQQACFINDQDATLVGRCPGGLFYWEKEFSNKNIQMFDDGYSQSKFYPSLKIFAGVAKKNELHIFDMEKRQFQKPLKAGMDIMDFDFNSDTSQVVLSMSNRKIGNEKKSLVEIRGGINFKVKYKISTTESHLVKFSKDDLALAVAQNDSITFFATSTRDTIGARSFNAKISYLDSYHSIDNNDYPKEYWLIGLENGETHIINKYNVNEEQILSGGVLPIMSIKGGRSMEGKDIFGDTIFSNNIFSTNGNSIFHYKKGKKDDHFLLQAEWHPSSPVTSIFFKNEGAHIQHFYTTEQDGFVKKWYLDMNEIIHLVTKENIYGKIWDPEFQPMTEKTNTR